MGLKYSVKRVLNRMGYEITRPGQHPRTHSDVLQGLADEPATVIDVGVADGTPELYAAFPHARLVLVEPLVEWEPSLQRICTQRDAVYELCAADEAEGEVVMRLPENLLNAGTRSQGRERTVPTRSVDALYGRHGKGAPVLLKIDVDGGELPVLRGSIETLRECVAVIVEVLTADSIATTLPFMYEQGFVLRDIAYPTYHDGDLAHLDAVFGRPRGFEGRAGF